MFSIVTGKTIARLLDEDRTGCIDVVKDTYLAHSNGLTVNPHSSFLRLSEGANSRIIALPAHVGEPSHVSGIKWIASYPDNVRLGLPRASAVLILNDVTNGFPFACMEASLISAARTAASAVLAAEHLVADAGGRRIRTLSIIGTGFIARFVYRFLLGASWTIENLLVYDIEPTAAERFATEVMPRSPQTKVRVTPDPESAIHAADLVLFSTVAPKPHIHDAAVFEHNPVVLHLSLRDIAPELIVESYNIVDDTDHAMQANTSLHLAEKLTGSRSFVTGTLAEAIQGLRQLERDRPCIFSPFGLGVLDVAVGKWLYDRAIETGQYTSVPEFFDFA